MSRIGHRALGDRSLSGAPYREGGQCLLDMAKILDSAPDVSDLGFGSLLDLAARRVRIHAKQEQLADLVEREAGVARAG